MIYNFPCIYKDELLYSVLGRCHLTDGNKNTKIILEQLFNKSTIIPVIDIPCNIEKLCSNIPEELGYSSDTIIMNCTLFSLYSPFMGKERRRECIDTIKFEDGRGIKHRIGIIAGSICRKKSIYYCPECVRFEIEHCDEAFIHRLHQVQGVYICEKHLCKLKEYKQVPLNRLQFNYIDVDKIDIKSEFIVDSNPMHRKLLKITEEVKYILENDLSTCLDQTIIYQRYYKILFEREYLTGKNSVKKLKLINDFTDYYGKNFLIYLDSEIDVSNESNWLNSILSKSKRAIHPIRHILLIDFLTGSIEQFIKYKEEQKIYPCMNRWCNCYKDDRMTKIIITSDYKSRELVATVKCEECGFTYSRKVKKDIYEIGRIKDFGIVWFNKLIEVVKTSMSLRAMAREMGCDCKTVVKYAEKLGYGHLICSNMNVDIGKEKSVAKPKFDEAENYKRGIIMFMEENPCATITTIKNNKYKEYMWLYRNDLEWLKHNLPEPLKKSNKGVNRIDWGKRDSLLLLLLMKEYNSIKNNKESVRITKTLLARRTGILSYVEKKLDKLPLCKMYLENAQETVEQYQIRRVDSICFELYSKNENIIDWKIKRLAGLRNNISDIVKERIENNIIKYTKIC